jgi:uncharacterized protein YndB with AHSA1/START domain
MARALVVALLISVASGGAAAEVADSATNGFTIKQTVVMKAPPEQVYRAVINVGNWWDPAHTYSGDTHNLSIEEKPMGCWCEKLTNGGAVRHMEVVMLTPGKLLRFSGGLGPLQALGVSGSMTFKFTPAEGGTKLDVTYVVGGYAAGGLNILAAPVDGILMQQLSRLKQYVETGKPATQVPPQ